MLRALWSRKWWLVVPAVIGAATAAVVSALWPARYVSYSQLMVAPSRVGPDYVRPLNSVSLEDQLDAIRITILSRTRLERMVQEFSLYAEERQSGALMQEIVERFRRDVSFDVVSPGDGRTGVFRVSYTGSDPRTVRNVAEKISALFIDESSNGRRLMAEGTARFLESQSEQAKKRLVEHEAKLSGLGRRLNVAETTEFDVLRSTYRSLLEKQQELRLAEELDKRLMGESFKVVDSAIYPERPIGPTRTHMNLMGAGAGLVMGLVLVAALPSRRSLAKAGQNLTK